MKPLFLRIFVLTKTNRSKKDKKVATIQVNRYWLACFFNNINKQKKHYEHNKQQKHHSKKLG